MEREYTEGYLKRLRNLKLYSDKTDEEIIEMLKQKKATVTIEPTSNKSYDKRFQEILEMLQSEHGLDMNNSNDKEMTINLVRQMMQSENVNKDILSIQNRPDKTKEDIGTLKALGDFQRDVQITIADLQDKLGISRKIRKEKSIDDIPQFIDGLLTKAKDFWERKTVVVDCPKCQIELLRYWLNFPEETTLASFTMRCPHCEEKVTYNG